MRKYGTSHFPEAQRRDGRSVALAVLFVGVGLVELIVLSI
jgi:hypothetical protein